MDLKNFKFMDVNILFGIINMKLRDEFESLDDLISYFDISREGLIERLKENGFYFHEETNQFRRV